MQLLSDKIASLRRACKRAKILAFFLTALLALPFLLLISLTGFHIDSDRLDDEIKEDAVTDDADTDQIHEIEPCVVHVHDDERRNRIDYERIDPILGTLFHKVSSFSYFSMMSGAEI